MAEVQPMLLRIAPFDATKGSSLYYTYSGSSQTLENNLRITDVGTGMIVYDFNHSSFEKVHHIPPDAIQNGKTYKAKLRVKFLDGTYSPYSNEVEFKAIATPVLDIENIDGQGYVYNSDITFIARYSQPNGERVKTYRYHLYDENEDLIKSFPLRVPSDGAGIILTETASKLEKGKGYFIEISIETVNGFVWSQRERFIPLYIVPSINGLVQTRNDSKEGFVRITANLKQLLGTQVKPDPDDPYISDNYEYEDDDWIVVPPDQPLIYKGLGMNRASDFIMKLWCRNVPDNSKFLELTPKDKKGIGIQFWKYKDRIVAEKRYNNVVSRHVSNVVTVPNNVDYMLYVKVIEHRIELYITIL